MYVVRQGVVDEMMSVECGKELHRDSTIWRRYDQDDALRCYATTRALLLLFYTPPPA